MNNSINKLLTAAKETCTSTVHDFVAYARVNNVDIPDEMVAAFFAQSNVQFKPKKTASSNKGKSRTSSYLLFKREKTTEYREILNDEDRLTEFLNVETPTDKEHERITAIREWFEKNTGTGPNANILSKMASLEWNRVSPETREQYTAEARRENHANAAADSDGTESSGGSPGATKSERNIEPESLTNFKNNDFKRFESDDSHDPSKCGAWFNMKEQYCSRAASEEETFCVVHRRQYTSALEKYGADTSPADTADTESESGED